MKYSPGDKVKIPKTCSDLASFNSIERFRKEISNYSLPYLIVSATHDDLDVTLRRADDILLQEDLFHESDLELYQEEMTELPEKWCVPVTEDSISDLIKWRGKIYHPSGYVRNDKYFITEPYGNAVISFETFCKYVLKEEPKQSTNMKREIIGYTLVRPEYKQACKIIAGTETDYTVVGSFSLETIAHERFIKAGVLDLWFKPVYAKEKPKLPKLGDHEGKFENGLITYGCYSISKELIETVYSIIDVESIVIRGKNITAYQIKQIVEAIKANESSK